MKISEFAAMNNVTTKMLRHYDEIGLLKPASIDIATGYRSYEEDQSLRLGWILILKNLGFSLLEIQELLCKSVCSSRFVEELRRKRIEISLEMNEQYQKKVQIDKLIGIMEKEGFKMDKKLNLMDFDMENVNELKKNMPHLEHFLESIETIMEECGDNEPVSIARFDISHFKSVNDDYGYEVGDRVILACYNVIYECAAQVLTKHAIARLGGDEFGVFAVADNVTIKSFCEHIIESLSQVDWIALGCNKQISCYLGVLVGKKQTMDSMRRNLDDTMDVMRRAAKKGPNSIIIETF